MGRNDVKDPERKRAGCGDTDAPRMSGAGGAAGAMMAPRPVRSIAIQAAGCGTAARGLPRGDPIARRASPFRANYRSIVERTIKLARTVHPREISSHRRVAVLLNAQFLGSADRRGHKATKSAIADASRNPRPDIHSCTAEEAAKPHSDEDGSSV